MAGISKIRRMPPEVRDLIAELRHTHGWTIDQIMEVLRDLAAGKTPSLPENLPPSLTDPPPIQPELVPHRSNLGAHIQGLDALAEKLHKTRAIAEALVRKTGTEESRLTQLNVELMHSVITELVLAAESGELAPCDDGKEGSLPVSVLQDPAKVMFLAKSLDHLASARKKDADMVLKLREEVRVEMQRKAATAAEKVQKEVRKAGMTQDTEDRIRSILAGAFS